MEILWRQGLWKKNRKGKFSEDMVEDWMEEPKRAPSPGDLPLCLRKHRSLGTGVHLEVTWLHPNSPADRQGRWGHPPPPPHAGMQETTAGRKKTNPSPKRKQQERPKNTTVFCRMFPLDWVRCRGDISMGLHPDFPPSRCQWEGAWLPGADTSKGHVYHR